MMRFAICSVLFLAFGLVEEGRAQTTHVVQVFDNFFTPKDLHIQPGDTVRWDWMQGAHTITSGLGAACPNAGVLFDAPSDAGQPSFAFTFDDAGKFDYFCRPHESLDMVGSVSVSALNLIGTPSAGSFVFFSLANVPSSDDGGRALVLLSVSGTSPGIRLPEGACSRVVDLHFDPVTQLGLSIAPILTTRSIRRGTASTSSIQLPAGLPVGLPVYYGGVVLRSSGFGSVLPTEVVVTL